MESVSGPKVHFQNQQSFLHVVVILLVRDYGELPDLSNFKARPWAT